jgi:hypothetical protein
MNGRKKKERRKKGAATCDAALLYWRADVGDGQRRGSTWRARKGGERGESCLEGDE